eukprot:3244383-Rhodomonas_salina.2
MRGTERAYGGTEELLDAPPIPGGAGTIPLVQKPKRETTFAVQFVPGAWFLLDCILLHPEIKYSGCACGVSGTERRMVLWFAYGVSL